MDNYGFYIKKLILRGYETEDAILTFTEGFNAVTGASDTGKSFAFECIDFALGSKELPDIIDEAEKYHEVLLEIVSYKNTSIYTLKRNIRDKGSYLFTCAIDDIHKNQAIELSSRHSGKKSISKFLLELCNANYKIILTSQKKGKTRAFSFRDFVHLMMASESKIIWKTSPIFTSESKSSITRIGEIAAFNTVMNGIDYPDTKSKEDVEIIQARIKGKIEVLVDLVSNLRKEVAEDYQIISNNNLDGIQTEIACIKDALNQNKTNIDVVEKRLLELWLKNQEFERERDLLKELNSRFVLLRKNYESDIERMDFICESQFYISQLINIICPVCESKWENNSEDLKETYLRYERAIMEEKSKVQNQLVDLQSTIDDLTIKICHYDDTISTTKTLIDELENTIENQLKPMVAFYIDRINTLYSEKDLHSRLQLNESRIKQYEKEVHEYQLALINQCENRGYLGDIGLEAIRAFCNLVKTLLNNWSFGNDPVGFNNENIDIKISNKDKRSFGKGSRAILNSAFLIAIMQYCIHVELPHPKVVILDSPLTTYKEKDLSSNEPNEDVPEIVKQAFYSYLSKFNKGMQIIIFDNIEPNSETIKKITYHHFSSNEHVGRYGFIPISETPSIFY